MNCRVAGRLLVGAIFAAGGLSGCSGDSGSGYGARSACQDWVKDQLKAPSTADFANESGYTSDTGPWTIMGSVDAENSFGARIRNSYACEVRLDGDYYRGSATLLE